MSRSALVLAGGESRRLGREKASVHVGGCPVVWRVLDAALPGVDGADVWLSARDPRSAEKLLSGYPSVDRVRVIADDEPGRGPVGGLAGLSRVQADLVAVLSGDMPFVSVDLIRGLLDALDWSDRDVVVPRVEGRDQRLCAAYRAEVGAVATRLLEATRAGARGPRVQDVLDRVPVDYVGRIGDIGQDELATQCRGINTPEDLEWARELTETD